ncbi:MAG: hypothetical protein ACYC8T_12490 [Myxococcaceae bacterium]
MHSRLLLAASLTVLASCKCADKPVEASAPRPAEPVKPAAAVVPAAPAPSATREPLGPGLNVDPEKGAQVPALALGSDGQPLVAWGENGAVHVRRWNGASWEVVGGGPVTGARTRLVGGRPPHLSVAGDGTVWLAWEEYGKNDVIRVHVASLKDGGWADAGGELGEKDHAQHAAFSAAGAAPMVAWREQDGEVVRLRVRQWVNGEWKPAGDGKLFASEKATTLQAASMVAVQGAPVIGWIEREPGKVMAHARRWDEAKQGWFFMPELAGADGDSSISLVASSDGVLYASLTWNAGQRPFRKLAPGATAWTEVSLPKTAVQAGDARFSATPAGAAMSWPASGMAIARWDGKAWTELDQALFSGTGNPVPVALGPDGVTVYAAYLDTGPQGDHEAQLRVVAYRPAADAGANR